MGLCFAPNGTTTALNHYKHFKIFNTPDGYMLRSAGNITDFFTVILASIAMRTKEGELIDFAMPCVFGVCFLIIAMYGATYIFENIVEPIFPWYTYFFGIHASQKGKILSKAPGGTAGERSEYKRTPGYSNSSVAESEPLSFIQIKEWYYLSILIGVVLMGLIPANYYGHSSYYVAAFSTGLLFSKQTIIPHSWIHNIRPFMLWMMRIFFAARIGFVIPFEDIWQKRNIF
eukprot:UN32838